jgi:hypothetical protein
MAMKRHSFAFNHLDMIEYHARRLVAGHAEKSEKITSWNCIRLEWMYI